MVCCTVSPLSSSAFVHSCIRARPCRCVSHQLLPSMHAGELAVVKAERDTLQRQLEAAERAKERVEAVGAQCCFHMIV